jgi:anti-anti-sigma factor
VSFSHTVQKSNGAVVYSLSGRLTAGEAVNELSKSLRDLVEKGERKFVLDFRAVTYIDSAALGALVSWYVTMRRNDCEIKLTNLGANATGLGSL